MYLHVFFIPFFFFATQVYDQNSKHIGKFNLIQKMSLNFKTLKLDATRFMC